MHRASFAVLGLFLSSACGQEEGSEGGGPDGVPDPGQVRTVEEACRVLGDCNFRSIEGPTEQLWRIEVRRDAEGTYRLGGLRSVRVQETSGVPLAPADGPVFVVGLDADGEPVDGQPVFFPEVDVFETRPERSVIEESIEGLAQTQIGYVRARPEVERIALMDGTAEVELDGLDVSDADPDELAIETSASGLNVPASVCGNVTLVENVEIEGVGMAQSPGAFQLAETGKALDKLPSTVCSGVSRIAFVDLGASTTLGRVVSRRGDLVMINTGFEYPEIPDFFSDANLQKSPFARLILQLTVIHEAVHAAENLLGRDARSNVEGDWNRGAQGSADGLVEGARLQKGFRKEWRRMHEAFVSRGWAARYGSLSANDSGTSFAQGGVMNSYGNATPAEDIAETASWIVMSKDFAAKGIEVDAGKREDYGCIEYRGRSDDTVPGQLSALYSKIRFLEDLKLVQPQQAKDCLANASLREGLSEGMHFGTAGAAGRNGFTTDVQAGIQTQQSGQRYFWVEASGRASFGDEGPFPARARLEVAMDPNADIEDVSWPRGHYTMDSEAHGFYLLFLDEENRAGNFYSTVGDVLFGAATNDRIRATVVLQRALRPEAPIIPIPETFDPPLIIDVVLEN